MSKGGRHPLLQPLQLLLEDPSWLNAKNAETAFLVVIHLLMASIKSCCIPIATPRDTRRHTPLQHPFKSKKLVQCCLSRMDSTIPPPESGVQQSASISTLAPWKKLSQGSWAPWRPDNWSTLSGPIFETWEPALSLNSTWHKNDEMTFWKEAGLAGISSVQL